MRPGALFVSALALFALLGLLAGRPASSPPPPESAVMPSPPRARPDGGDPEQLARRWGRTFAVWTQRSLADGLEALAASASPELAADLRRGAQATRRDDTLLRDGAGSRGSIEVVRVRGDGPRRDALVVTREAPYVGSGSDLHGPRYRVYVGTVVQDERGLWRMDSWERQP